MIISNATVCAAMDHGGNRKYKIVESRQRQQEENNRERGSEQGEQEIQERWRN
jgi:hypothetical protein